MFILEGGTHELIRLQAGLGLASALQECLSQPHCVPVLSYFIDPPTSWGTVGEQRDCV